MINRKPLLGRSKPGERLTREEIAALENVTTPPVHPGPANGKPPGNKGGRPQVDRGGFPQVNGDGRPQVNRGGGPQGDNGAGPKLTVPRDLLKFRWSLECPGCGFKVNGDGQPQPGQRLARCGRCKLIILLGK